MHPAGAPLGCGAGGLIVLLAPPPAPWGSHPQLRGFFFFKYFIRSGNKLGPEPRDWLLAKLQLQAQLAELGLVGFFFYLFILLQSVHLFPFPGVIGSKNSCKSAAGLGGGFVGPARVCVPPHAVPM